MPKEFCWVLPLILAELPSLARGKDGHDAVPVIGFELLRGVDEDAGRVNARENRRDVQNGGGGAGRLERCQGGYWFRMLEVRRSKEAEEKRMIGSGRERFLREETRGPLLLSAVEGTVKVDMVEGMLWAAEEYFGGISDE